MKSIICADAEDTIQKILTRILESRGYDVRMYGNGEEVINAFNQRKADLILLDVSMPVKSGLETCRELRRSPDSFDVPIIMISGLGSEDSITEGLEAGADDYVAKPVSMKELIKRIEGFLDGAESP